MNEIQSKIHGSKLTKTQKVIANYILDHSSDACFLTSTEIAQILNVSDSSVIRFARTVGYKGFMDFQKALRQEYQDNAFSISNTITVPAKRFSTYNQGAKTPDVISNHYKNAMRNIESALIQNPKDKFERAAQMLINSKRKFIIATRSNVCLGDYLLLYLKHMLPNVEFASLGAETPIDSLCHISKDDCVIFFSFPRYSALDKLAAEMALAAGAKIIVITDKPSALLTRYASLFFTVPVDSNAFFNSLVGAQFITEVLCNTVSRKVRGLEKRLRNIDKYLNELGVY